MKIIIICILCILIALIIWDKIDDYKEKKKEIKKHTSS